MLRRAWKTTTVLGVVASTLSLVNLISQVFRIGIGAPFRAVLRLYSSLVESALGWADEPMRQLVEAISTWTQISLHLSPDWKHVVVLMWFYFSVDAKSSFTQGRRTTGILTLLMALPIIVGIVCATAVGLQTFGALWTLLAAILGFIVHAVAESIVASLLYREGVQSIRRALAHHGLTEILSALVAGVCSIVIDLVFFRRTGDANASAAALACFVVIRGMFWLFRGFYIAAIGRHAGGSWSSRLLHTGSGQFGALFGAVLIGTTLFLAFNAGLG